MGNLLMEIDSETVVDILQCKRECGARVSSLVTSIGQLLNNSQEVHFRYVYRETNMCGVFTSEAT